MHSPRVIFVAIVTGQFMLISGFVTPPPPGGATTSPLYGIYADDTTFTSSAEDPCVLDHKTNYDVNLIQSWLSANILTFNIKKPKYMLIESQFKLSQINN